MNFHGLAGAKRHSREGGNLLIYSTNLLRIYSLPPWRKMIILKPQIARITLIFSQLQIKLI